MAANSKSKWVPVFTKWRHGGWYVSNLHYPSGASGCVSNNYPDKKWRIACDDRRVGGLGGEGDFTYKSRDAAARAEYDLVQRLVVPGQKYDQKDFEASPEKYSRFRTARIAEKMLTWQGLEVGQVVKIEFVFAQVNVVADKAIMPVYKVWAADAASEDDFVMMYARALMDFCL